MTFGWVRLWLTVGLGGRLKVAKAAAELPHSKVGTMTIRERLEWLSRMVFLVFILASAAFLSAITAMRVAIHGREVSMPNLVGRNVAEAGQSLRSEGLLLRGGGWGVRGLAVNPRVRAEPPPGA